MYNTGVIIIFICVGLPIICATIVKMNKNNAKNGGDINPETQNEIKEMKARIQDLETIIFDLEKRDSYGK